MFLRPQYRFIAPAALYGGGSILQEDYTAADTMTWVTHARTGHAMMFDSTGKLTWAPNNLLLYSNKFDDANWTGARYTVSSGQSDPDGGSNAWKLFDTTGTGDHVILQPGLPGGQTNTVSIAAKAGVGAGYIGLATFSVSFTGDSVFGNTICGVVANLNSGTVSTSTSTGFVGSSISSLGSGWYLISIVCTDSTQVRVYNMSDATTYSYTGDSSHYNLIYKACYARTTYETSARSADRVITTSAAYYGPRFDYDPATLAARGLLREMARTNVVLWNRDLTDAAWTKTNATAAKDQTGIDGVSNSASKITATAGNGTCLQAITLASSARAQSAWVKRITGSGTVEMTMDNGSTWTAVTVTGSWTRVAIPTQTLANPTVGFRLVTSGDAIAVDMVQNEDGTAWTSEIPTTSSSITRNADTLTPTLYTSDSVTEYYRLVSDLSQSSRTVNPFSGVSSETDSVWIERFTKP